MKGAIRSIIAVSLIFAGIILMGIGGNMGGFKKINFSQWDTVDIDEVINSDNIKSVKIDFSVGDFSVKRGDEARIEGEVFKDKFNYSCEDGNLVIDYNFKNRKIFTGFSDISFNDMKVTLYLPDKEYKEFELKMGVGSLRIDGLSAEYADLKLGIGQSIFENMDISELNLKTGIGETNFSGKVTGDSKLNSGIGEVNMNITTGNTIFDFDVDSGIGSVNIDKGKDSRNFDEDHTFNVSSGIGAVNIDVNND